MPFTSATGNGSSEPLTISANGRFIGFHSSAGNVVLDDTNGSDDYFIKDLQTGQTILANSASDGAHGNGAAFAGDNATIASNGSAVFYSQASNLVNGDTNGHDDVFVKNVITGAIQRVSTSTDGTEAQRLTRSTR